MFCKTRLQDLRWVLSIGESDGKLEDGREGEGRVVLSPLDLRLHLQQQLLYFCVPASCWMSLLPVILAPGNHLLLLFLEWGVVEASLCC